MRCVNIQGDFAQPSSSFPVDVASAGVTWALVGLRNVPDRRTSFLLELEQEGGPTLKLPVQVKTVAKGRLEVTILSADTGKPVPAMVRLVWKTDGLDRKPSNAIEFAEQFNNIGSGRRKANLPGRLRGAYWCVPEPFDMRTSLPIGLPEASSRANWISESLSSQATAYSKPFQTSAVPLGPVQPPSTTSLPILPPAASRRVK